VLFYLANIGKKWENLSFGFDFGKKKSFRFVSYKKMSIFAAALKLNRYGYI